MNKLELKIGRGRVKVDARDDVDQSVAAEIFKHREYRIAEERIAGAVNPIVDVGAHIGIFSLYCATLNPRVEIYALEPEPKNFIWLEKNLSANGATTVRPIEAGLAGATGERWLRLTADNHNHYLAPTGASDDAKSKKVSVYSLADFLKKKKIKAVALLKMDIEGGEYEALSSLGKKVLAQIGAILLEYHDAVGAGHKILEKQLREEGFGVQTFPSKFDRKMGFIYAVNKKNKIL
ncbi:MAG: FkbM family methyltransferase [Patescibacteria group bacterium]|nr:FkbM family methyltransferase [Patescibacteria group bacterium]